MIFPTVREVSFTLRRKFLHKLLFKMSWAIEKEWRAEGLEKKYLMEGQAIAADASLQTQRL